MNIQKHVHETKEISLVSCGCDIIDYTAIKTLMCLEIMVFGMHLWSFFIFYFSAALWLMLTETPVSFSSGRFLMESLIMSEGKKEKALSGIKF